MKALTNGIFILFIFFLNKKQAGSQLVRPSDYLNEHRSNSLTPFLPSNQVPGPFRPIISPIKNYTQDFPNKLSNINNHVKYLSANKILKESLPIALTKHHDFTPQVMIIVLLFLCYLKTILNTKLTYV